ncbi:MAG: uroporphyrinogen decarboxylase family protein [Bifidobacterium adolescentis]|nr:uroporphyrinogen decarboxylase family protein [Bifidobacterium adolescentis]
MAIDKKQSFHDILQGEGNVPYLTSAWQHLIGHEYGAQEQAQAHIDFVKKWDWDYVKINPRSAYYSETWGATFDHDDYGAGRSPRLTKTLITKPEQVNDVAYVDPESSPVLQEEVQATALVHQALSDRVVLQTVFSPLTVLLGLAALPRVNHHPLYGNSPVLTPDELLKTDPEATKRALDAIAHTLADYVKLLVAPTEQGGAGVDGIFYAVTGTASRGYFTRDEFLEFADPYDRIVLDAAGGHIKLLHTCKEHSNPDWFADYPIDALQWDTFLEGNPAITDEFGATPVAGPASTLLAEGADLQELKRQIQETINARRDGKPFFLAPSCTVPPKPGEENFRILREA